MSKFKRSVSVWRDIVQYNSTILYSSSDCTATTSGVDPFPTLDWRGHPTSSLFSVGVAGECRRCSGTPRVKYQAVLLSVCELKILLLQALSIKNAPERAIFRRKTKKNYGERAYHLIKRWTLRVEWILHQPQVHGKPRLPHTHTHTQSKRNT